MRQLKVVCVGDGGTGKTSLLMTKTTGRFPWDYIPSVFDNLPIPIPDIDGVPATLDLWDLPRGEDAERVRPLAYPDTKVFLLFFSLVSPKSWVNITRKWVPEVSLHCPGTPFVLVGTKYDLRDDPDTVGRLKERHEAPIDFASGLRLAKSIKAWAYFELSATENPKGLERLFDTLIEIYKIQMRKPVAQPKTGFFKSFIQSLGKPKPPPTAAVPKLSASADQFKTTSPGDPLESGLPDEFWLEVFQRLPVSDLGHIASVSKRFKRLSEKDLVWLRFLRTVPDTSLQPAKDYVKRKYGQCWLNPLFLPNTQAAPHLLLYYYGFREAQIRQVPTLLSATVLQQPLPD